MAIANSSFLVFYCAVISLAESTCTAVNPNVAVGAALLQITSHTLKSRESMSFQTHSDKLARQTFQRRASGEDLQSESALGLIDSRQLAYETTFEMLGEGIKDGLDGFPALWSASGCTQAPPATSDGRNLSFVADVATSHDPAKQEMCYGYSAGKQAGLDPVKLFLEPTVEKLSCDAAKGQKLRAEFNISVDPAKQAAKKKLFQMVARGFQKMNVPVVMTAGLILGWWRECDFLAHDNDMDVAVLHRYLPADFVKQLEQIGFQVFVRVAIEASFAQVYDNAGLEITLKHKDAPGIWCDVFVWEELPLAASDALVPPTLEVYQSLWYRNNHGHFWSCKQKFQSLAQIRWNDVDVYIPYPPELHLETKYGHDWMVPKAKGWCIYCDCDKKPEHVRGRAPWQKQWSLS